MSTSGAEGAFNSNVSGSRGVVLDTGDGYVPTVEGGQAVGQLALGVLANVVAAAIGRSIGIVEPVKQDDRGSVGAQFQLAPQFDVGLGQLDAV